MIVKQIKKLVPNLQIFNARPTDKIMKKEGQRTDRSLTDGDKPVDQNKMQGNMAMGKKNSKKYLLSDEEDADNPLGSAGDGVVEKESNYKKRKGDERLKEQPSNAKDNHDGEKKREKKLKLEAKEDDIADDSKFPSVDSHMEKDLKRKKQKKEKLSMNAASVQAEESNISIKGDRKLRNKKQHAGSVIDNVEAPSTELFATEAAETTNRGKMMDTGSVPDIGSGAFVITPAKNKKKKSRSTWGSIADSPMDEVGLGGPSTWDD